MADCKRCKKPTAEFPLNKFGKPSTMCQRCYENTVERNARKFEAAKLERASLKPGMGFCMACKKPKPIEDFVTNPKQRRKIARGETFAKNCADCRERLVTNLNEKRHESHKDPVVKEAYLAERRNRMRAWRFKIITAYGAACACCGETIYQFLELHHKNNDGHAHRKEIGANSEALYRWLEKNGFPDTMELICASCHNAVSFYGECPHKTRPQDFDLKAHPEVTVQ